MVYAEALAAGTPVVASKNTPWQDVEKHNCGKWVENTPEKFAEAITEILNSDSIQMGKNGNDFISEYLSWDKIAKAFIENAKRII
jgi:glycosyltransferase involved in cell wall biosynthesis